MPKDDLDGTIPVNYLEEFEEEPFTWVDVVICILAIPLALPIFILKRLFSK